MNKKAKLKRYIDALDFAIYEMVLYMDTHPTCTRSQNAFNELKRRRKEAIAAYEAEFGDYVTTAASVTPRGEWSWINGPWPWENEGVEN